MQTSDKFPVKEVRAKTRTLYVHSVFELAGIEILFKAVSVFGMNPLLKKMLNVSMKASSLDYLTNNFAVILKKPLYLVTLIVAAVLIALWSFLEIALLVEGVDRIRKGQPVTVIQLLKETASSLKRALMPKNLPLLLVSGFIMPLTAFLYSGTYLNQMQIPAYIMDAVYASTLYLCIYAVCMLILIVLAVCWLFLFQCFVLEKEDFPTAAKHSFAIVKKHWIRDLWEVIRMNLIIIVKWFFLLVAACLLTFLVIVLIHNDSIALGFSIVFAQMLVPAIQFIITIVGNIGQYCVLGAIFCTSVYGSEWEVIPQPKQSFRSRAFLPLCAVVSVAVVAVSTAFATAWPEMCLNTASLSVSVTAHRGYTQTQPENTLPAFQAAIDSGIVDYGELDVQMTSDGVVVVSHDATLKRTTGVNKKICDMTYEEVKQLTVTAEDENGNTVTAPIPTLEEVLALCKDRLKLNIEIKACAQSPDLEKETVKLIEKYGFEDQCTITSLTYESLEKVKAENSSLRTGYILAMGAGSYYDLPAADFFSVETTFISTSMVNQIHERGKTVSAWTVSSSDDAEKMLKCGVDDIITNNPNVITVEIASFDGTPVEFYDIYQSIWGITTEEAGSDAEDA